MKPLPETRQARTPLQEGVSIIPYLLLYQRMHRRRWLGALAGLALVSSVAWFLRQRD